MKTYVLIFAFLPLTLAFMANGPGGADYVFRSLFLLWVGVEVCGSMHAYASRKSIESQYAKYEARFSAALDADDFDTARECIRSSELFSERGLK